MQNIIENILFKPVSKAIIDILLITGLILSIISARSAENSWLSFHCIVSMTWYALMLIHIWQHWRMTKSLLKLNRKTLKRNKITLLTIVIFILMTFSVILFIGDVSYKFVRIHHAINHVGMFVIVAHTIAKAKQFMTYFR